MALDPGIFQLLNTKGGPASNLAAVRDYENAGIQGQLGQAQIQRVGLENQQLQQEMALRPDALKLKQAQAEAAIQENLAKMDKAKLDKTNAWNTRAGQIWASVSDEPSYQRAKAAIRQEAIANGVQIPEGYDPHPPVYDPGFVRQEVEKSMTMDQRLKQEENRRAGEWKERQFTADERHRRAMESKPSATLVMAGQPQVGTIPPGYRYDPRTNAMERIPGSPADTKSAEQVAKEEGTIATTDITIDTAKRLLSHPGLTGAVGTYGLTKYVPGTDAATFAAELDTFKAQTFIPQVQAMKGMGALSDAEGKKLTDAIGALNPNMSEKAFKESLKRIVFTLEGANARARKRISIQGAPTTTPAVPNRPTATGANGQKLILSADGKSWEEVK
jgi:hypothetical protein